MKGVRSLDMARQGLGQWPAPTLRWTRQPERERLAPDRGAARRAPWSDSARHSAPGVSSASPAEHPSQPDDEGQRSGDVVHVVRRATARRDWPNGGAHRASSHRVGGTTSWSHARRAKPSRGVRRRSFMPIVQASKPGAFT